MALPHVVLVDPSDTREVLAERLRMQGYAVTVAFDAAEGARLALSEPPAVVVAHLWMQGISGVQLCRLLRSEPATVNVPVILRGPEQLRDRFWAERAGAAAYVALGRMGDLVRALARALAASPPAETDAFFTQLPAAEFDLRDRIAAHLDTALFESVIAAETRALSGCETFPRLFDLLSQFLTQVTRYRWLAVHTQRPDRFGLHTHPCTRAECEAQVREVLALPMETWAVAVEDEDATNETGPSEYRVEPIKIGGEVLGRIAMAVDGEMQAHDVELLRLIARELGGPIRIATLMEESQRLAMVDPLTGLLNRRAFTSALDRNISASERTGEPLSFVLLDVDHFKHINDQYGHGTGDLVLSSLGRLLMGRARRSDVVGRWGGEEFVLGLPGADFEASKVVAERLREAIASLVVEGPAGRRVPVTASLGVTTFLMGDAMEDLADRADRAMYRAKAGGRNRVEGDEPVRLPASLALAE